MRFGAGGSFAGSGDAGIGDNDTATVPSKDLLKDLVSPRHLGARRIDPVTKDYVMGPTGKLSGMSPVQQKVHLALTTALQSSSVIGLGQDFSQIQKIGSNFQADVTERVTRALSDLTNSSQVQLVSVTTISLSSTGQFAHIQWRDLTTSEEHTSTI